MILPQKDLFRVNEVAQYFDVTVRTVYEWLKEGRLEAIRTPGRSIRIVRKSIENHLSYREK